MLKSQIWDTAGQERFRALTSAYYRGASGALLAFDITKERSFENCQRWVRDLRENSSKNLVIVLVGNKTDLEEQRAVSLEQVKKFASGHKLLYVETSACSGDNVDKAFRLLVRKIYSNVHNNVLLGNKKQTKKITNTKALDMQRKVEKNSSCCITN